MKTFIPEYVECIEEAPFNCYGKIGTVYKVSVWNFSTNDCMLEETNSNSTSKRRFKPSTKEAYDAQFIVNKPKFVLPEKWYTKITSENKDIINHWRRNIIQYHNSDCQYETISQDGSGSSLNFMNEYKSYQEITFEQFKKYVLKEEIVEEKVIEPLPQFKVIESIETITKVENNEGNQFFIGDNIIKSTGKIPHKIKSFKYNNDKTNILALTNYNDLGININNIEHYIEPKVEVKDEFILPEKWFIKSTEETFNTIRNWAAKKLNHPKYKEYNHYHYVSFNYLGEYRQERHCTEITFDQFKKYVLKEDKPEIVEYPHDFKIGDKIKIRTTKDLNIYKIINIEGDVLFYHTDNIHYKNHCRVLAKNAIKVD